jgi:hypothetical protein
MCLSVLWPLCECACRALFVPPLLTPSFNFPSTAQDRCGRRRPDYLRKSAAVSRRLAPPWIDKIVGALGPPPPRHAGSVGLSWRGLDLPSSLQHSSPSSSRTPFLSRICSTMDPGNKIKSSYVSFASFRCHCSWSRIFHRHHGRVRTEVPRHEGHQC